MDRKDGARRHELREETASSKKRKNKRNKARRGVYEVGEARKSTVQGNSKATTSIGIAGNNSHCTMKQMNREEVTSNHTPQSNPSDATQAGRRTASTNDGKKGKKRRRQEVPAAAAELETLKSKLSASPRTRKPVTVSPSRRERSEVTYVATKKDKKNGRRGKAMDVDHSNGSTRTTTSSLPESISGKHGGKTIAGPAVPARLSELQKRMRQKLEGAQFRMINEALYTCGSGASLAKFREEPELFDVYHRGFREQVEKWPVHPLDIIISWLGKYPKARVADFGCGEARLAASVPNKVHSFDLVSRNPRVIACDMAHVPLEDSSVNIAVFCLSLMGTNLADFLREAYRVLVRGGIVKVAEVRSRFEGEKGGVERFLEVARRLGLDKTQMDRTNKMFLLAEFKKSSRTPEEGVTFEAKACMYKRR